MAEAFKESCNVTFAEIGLRLGAEKMSEQAQRFGFCPTDPPDRIDCIEPTIPFVLPFQEGHFPIPSYFTDNAPLLAFSSIGLGQRDHEPTAHGAGGGFDRERTER